MKTLKETIKDLPDGSLAKRQYQTLQERYADCVADMEFYALNDETSALYNIKEDAEKHNAVLREY